MTTPAPAPSRTDRMWSALADWIVSHPWTSIIVSLLVTLAVSAGSAGYIYSTDHRAFFGKDNPQLLAFEKLQEDYTKTDTVLIAVAPKDGKVFTPEFLGILQDLTKAGGEIGRAHV